MKTMQEFKKNKYMEDKVNTISDTLNSMSFRPEEFAYFFTQEHRTIQQNLTRLCVEWLRMCASDYYSYDLRNKASHELAKEIMKHEPTEGWYVPFI